jgi:diguanylate cyclase (GGDEF)-like protein/PAS domain S-box-containing protein
MEPSQSHTSQVPGDTSHSFEESGHAIEASENGDIDREERLRFHAQLLNAVGQAIIAMDLQGKVLYWNRGAEQLYGWSEREVMGRGLQEFLISEDLQDSAEEIMAQLRVGGSWSGEFMAQRKDGTFVPVQVTDTPVIDDHGNVVGIIGVSTDITERKRAEARLKDSEEKYRTLVEQIPAVIYVDTMEGIGYGGYTSPQAETMLGYPMDEWDADPLLWVKLLHPEDRERVVAENAQANANGEPFVLEYRMIARDGQVVWIRDDSGILHDEAGRPWRRQGVLLDITERKEVERKLSEAEARYRTLVERIPAIVYIQEPDEPSRTIYVSPQNEMILGYTPEECLATPDHWLKVMHPDDRERILWEGARTNGSGESFLAEYRQFAKDGRIVWIRDEATMVRDENGEPLYWLGVQTDITERKEAEERLKASEEELRALFEAMDDVVFEIDAQGRYLRVAPTNPALLYRRREEMIGKTLDDVLPAKTAEELLGHIRRALESSETVKIEYSLSIDGREVWFEGTITSLSEESVVFVGRDVTERKALEERLAHQALHDPLTDLPNRTLFTDRLRQALARTKRRQLSLTVMFMDLDNFKVINDSLGHKMGDRLLEAATKRIRSALRPEDTVARLGGDEFVFLLEDTDLDDAIHVTERILELLREPFSLGGRQLFVTASIGIAVGGDGKRAADLLRDADLAMYRAKHSGKARYAVFEETMNAQALERLELEHGLRRAVERNEFVVHYQPEVSLSTGKIVGFEALVRWEHPERGLLLPDQFVPLAEETGLIVPIGEAVLEEACRQAKEWHERRPSDPPAMGINLSARQFREPGLTESVARIIDETALEPSSLFLEVTESTAMRDALATATALEELQGLGVGTILDDFGTGYSSLSYLERFPVDFVKIDCSFVGGLDEYPGAKMLVSAMISLAHALDLKVIAEGVETEEQFERLRGMECDLAQGHLFSEPLTAKEAADLLVAVHHRNPLGSSRRGRGSPP